MISWFMKRLFKISGTEIETIEKQKAFVGKLKVFEKI